ncbi:sugar ABC transporter substrate-binding protein [Sinorhizobium meliloti WSM1022]|jgi:ribose transport system substrate-binding protein|uniref:sugar ABC transporter substrate-binding protein n=1 Tax=Rhizobium meliloti TaxID=382 RepID=UPI0004807929|nr:sugar ABC transporter substrate-binding protein [Sinorhizobium meliloti]ASQ02567.1 sugar ABC transporter substrate-binding protein [Sinorhizobium meliloti]MCO6422512.1 sugar ABC transporter substrate-binding protein [Sinorhizobium meliloti]MDW9411559.1 substrate-binding domain-containing protein [Sinorhizobium meliloti]MDW9417989.1 substrate-binding domain-containing protein [Sinorhizobium meliloti]MDW9441753.1 substrate-binding domain-containing protein [Sinorhizobium meliloti]
MSAMWRKAAALAVAGFLLNVTSANALNLAWVHANAAAQSEQRVKAGFDAWLKETGKDWNVSLLDSGGSGERTASNLQDAASRGVDAIIITMADLRASRAAIDAAIDAKIPIITVDSGYIPGVLVDVTTNNWAMSSDVSPYLLNELGGKGSIIFLRMAEHHGTRKRGDVMETILKEYPDVKVLAEHNIDYTAFFEDTTSTMQDYASRFGDEINAVWAPWDEPAQAAINVLQAAGLKTVKVIGIDGHPNAIAEVCKPDGLMIATVSQPFEKMGAQAGEWIEEIVVKKEDPAKVIPSKTVYMDAPLVTKQNCKDFLPK